MSNMNKRGFGTMKLKDPNRLASISRKGGQSAHAKGTGRHFNSAEARAAGQKGVETRRARKAR